MNARVINVFRDSRDFILADVLAESNSWREIAWPAIFLSSILWDCSYVLFIKTRFGRHWRPWQRVENTHLGQYLTLLQVCKSVNLAINVQRR